MYLRLIINFLYVLYVSVKNKEIILNYSYQKSFLFLQISTLPYLILDEGDLLKKKISKDNFLEKYSLYQYTLDDKMSII